MHLLILETSLPGSLLSKVTEVNLPDIVLRRGGIFAY